MKKLLILVMVAVMIGGVVAGCKGEVKTYTDSGQTIAVSANEEFIIALSSNPSSTGYSWQESYDGTVLELMEKKFEPGEQAKQVVGAGGTDYFRFKALKKGETEITMTYKRPWEKESAEQKIFTVNVK